MHICTHMRMQSRLRHTFTSVIVETIHRPLWNMRSVSHLAWVGAKLATTRTSASRPEAKRQKVAEQRKSACERNFHAALPDLAPRKMLIESPPSLCLAEMLATWRTSDSFPVHLLWPPPFHTIDDTNSSMRQKLLWKSSLSMNDSRGRSTSVGYSSCVVSMRECNFKNSRMGQKAVLKGRRWVTFFVPP